MFAGKFLKRGILFKAFSQNIPAGYHLYFNKYLIIVNYIRDIYHIDE